MAIAKRPCFYQIFSSNICSRRLKIPVRFVKHLEGKACGLVSLVGPSGNVWPVDLIEQNDDIFLSHGWEKFVRDHFIECGDLLVFRYDGELCFTMQVFDLSACEKEAAFHSKCGQDDVDIVLRDVGQKRQREEEAVSTLKVLEYETKRIRGTTSECTDNHEGWMSISGNEGCCCNEVNKIKPFQQESFYDETKQSPGLVDPELEATLRKRVGTDGNLNLHNKGYISAFSEREKRVSESFISRFPYFVRIMKQFNVSGSYTLNIPYQFSTVHLPNCRTEIILRTVKGSCWSVNSVPTTRVHTSHTLCGGWMAFVRSNDIKMGDVCIFELVRKFELRVFILRIAKDSLDIESGNAVASNALNAGSDAAPHKFGGLPSKSRKNLLKTHSKLVMNVEICDTEGPAKGQTIYFPSNKIKHGNAKNGSASAGDGMRMKVALDEAKAAKSFTSNFPNFVRVMRKFNISGSYTLKIPHKISAAHLPSCKTEIILRNLQGKCWVVNSVPDSKGRAVHTFCGGWMAFVRDNNVQMGDICMFELIGKTEMRVQISSVGQKVLDHQCGKLSSHDLSLVPFSGNCPSL